MKNELTANAVSFALSGFTPMISAAMSMSRIAIHDRPTVPRVRFRTIHADAITKNEAEQVGGPGCVDGPGDQRCPAPRAPAPLICPEAE